MLRRVLWWLQDRTWRWWCTGAAIELQEENRAEWRATLRLLVLSKAIRRV